MFDQILYFGFHILPNINLPFLLKRRMISSSKRFLCQGDVLLTTPGDVKSLELRFLEQLDLANDRQARRNTTQMRCGMTWIC